MAGLDLEALRNSAEALRDASPEVRARYIGTRDQVLGFMEELAALNDLDKAAVAYYIARVMKSVSGLHTWELSETVLNTAVGYTLAAAKLVGLDDLRN